MKKRKKMVIVIAIALMVACTHQSVKKERIQNRPAKETALPYVPSAFYDLSLFPGNVFELLINRL